MEMVLHRHSNNETMSIFIRYLALSLVLMPLLATISRTAGGSDDSFAAEFRQKFPHSLYLLGIGTVQKTGDLVKNRRVAEVTARLEIARQIKVHVKEQTLDVMCEGGRERLFKDRQECRNQFLMIIEESVDLFLEGSKIVASGEKNDVIYAIAVLERARAADVLDERSREAAVKARNELDRTRAGDREALKRAEEEFKRALAYEKEKEDLLNAKGHAESGLGDLERELLDVGVR